MWLKKKIETIKNNIKEPKNITKAMILAEPICEKIVNKNLCRFLEKDYKYVDNGSYRIFSNTKEAEQYLRPYLNEILIFLELPPFINFRVVFEEDFNDLSVNNKAGLYQGGWSSKTITINISKSYSFINVLAILCHECTHYFMEYNGLNWKDTDLNEERTDMMACLIGFGTILTKGYKIIEDVEYHIGFTTTRTSKIGYISSKECGEIYEYLQYRRKKIELQKINKKELEQQKIRLNSLIDLIKQFESQIDILHPLKDRSRYSSISKEQVNVLQTALADIESLGTSSVIKELERAIECAKTINDISLCIQMANKHCEKQLKIITKLQSISK